MRPMIARVALPVPLDKQSLITRFQNHLFPIIGGRGPRAFLDDKP